MSDTPSEPAGIGALAGSRIGHWSMVIGHFAPRLSAAEIAAHDAFVATLGGTPIWNEFSPKES